MQLKARVDMIDSQITKLERKNEAKPKNQVEGG